jgi:dTDP-4-dehydrorhamnose 3,5-epimerase-like enzyme
MIQASPWSNEFFGGKAKLLSCARHVDERGVLMPFDFNEMPFEPRRSFVISGASAGTVRGGHGHRSAQQMLVCLHGSIEVLMRHNQQEVSVLLEPGSPGLVFGPGVWCQQKYLFPASILLVFASEPYDPSSYVEHST